MRTEDLNFDLPSDLIAQAPSAHRQDSRLLHYRRGDESIHHRTFSDLPDLLRPGDLLVLNDSKVIPARIALRKSTGGLIEGLFLSEQSPGIWHTLLRDLGSPPGGTFLTFDADSQINASIRENLGAGEFLLEISDQSPAIDILSKLGRMPLPPYIKRDKLHDDRDELDRTRYQTIYAQSPGSIAAPTAGLHFTTDLLHRLDARGIERVMVTLHVGVGTFKPVTAEMLEAHVMHSESYSIEPNAADALNRAKKAGRRIVAVGTTSARVLETQPDNQPFAPGIGASDLFIYSPYRWKHVNALITNFHLPRSTLIALVAAMTGLPRQRGIYQDAISARYRFFSYGDAMFID
jgi:S-adenosylmethionine:tRNA ribosyltransferase-isomerase